MNKFKPLILQSFNNKYIGFMGVDYLTNGKCKVTIPDEVLEKIYPNIPDKEWLIFLSVYDDVDLFVEEIGENYFVIKERNQGKSNGVRFVWEFFAAPKPVKIADFIILMNTPSINERICGNADDYIDVEIEEKERVH